MNNKELFDFLTGKKCTEELNCIDWYEIFRCSVEQKTEGMLYKKILKESIGGQIEKPIKKMLYLSYNYNIIKNKLYLSEFTNLYKELINEVNYFIPYKGIFMIKYVYDDLGIRHMEDIDCLCDITNCININKLLKKLGYDLTLVNDSSILLNNAQDFAESLLFAKRLNHDAFVSSTKLDLRSIYTLSAEELNIIENSDTKNFSNLIKISFMLLCMEFYENSCLPSQQLLPENCTLMKYMDLYYFIQRYPIDTASILNCPIISNTNYMNYVHQCINFYSSDGGES